MSRKMRASAGAQLSKPPLGAESSRALLRQILLEISPPDLLALVAEIGA